MREKEREREREREGGEKEDGWILHENEIQTNAVFCINVCEKVEVEDEVML